MKSTNGNAGVRDDRGGAVKLSVHQRSDVKRCLGSIFWFDHPVLSHELSTEQSVAVP